MSVIILPPPPPLVTITQPKKYDVILCDPPWQYQGSQTKMGAAGKHYSLMSQQALFSLPVKSILKKKGMVLMWATGPKLHYAIDLMRQWGLHYRGIAFVWVKTRQSDNAIINGQGVPPTFTKPTAELVLLGTTKPTGRPLKLFKHNTPQVVLAPRAGHSTKPEIVRKLIEQTLGNQVDYLEMFARIKVGGWDAIGNGVTGEDIAISIGKLNGTISCPIQLPLPNP